jgi:hypothetical protein
MRTLRLLVPALLLSACPTDDPGGGTIGDGDSDDGDSGDTDDTGGGDTDTLDPVCTEPTDMECVDEMILDLSLHEEVNPDDVDNEQDGSDWVSLVDASAGGMNSSSDSPWIYVRFTESGMEKVEIDDESALEDMSWHLSARRYVVRLDSGSAGPGCVGAIVVKGKSYDEVSEADIEGANFKLENYYDDECEIIEDDSGLPGSIDVLLGGWWDYTSCLETTGQPFLVQLDDGHVLKLVVESYYKGEGQTECNEEGSTRKDGGFLTFRWQFLL